jgi:hypothetical protein
MAKVMEFFIYQNFRAVFILKIKLKIKISSNYRPEWFKRLKSNKKNAHSLVKNKTVSSKIMKQFLHR